MRDLTHTHTRTHAGEERVREREGETEGGTEGARERGGEGERVGGRECYLRLDTHTLVAYGLVHKHCKALH